VTEIKVGAITLAALAIAVALLVVLEDVHLRPGIRFAVTMERTGALKEGAPIRVAGLTLGKIERIALAASGDPEEPTSAVLHCWIEQRHAWLVRDDSEIFVNQTGIFGEQYLEVGAVRAGAPLRDGAVVKGIAPPRLDRVLANSYKNLEAATALIRDGMPELKALGAQLDELEGNLAALSPSPGDALLAWRNFRALAREARAVADGFEDQDLSSTRAKADALSAGITRAERDLAPRLRRLAGLFDKLAALRLGDFGRVVDDGRAILGRAERTYAALLLLAAYVTEGRGSLGALMQDAELNDDLKAMSKRLKRTPWEAAGHPSMRGQAPH
jgi:phospholipid/cholesterol/gamma-HCH transport system substrate-binding protein